MANNTEVLVERNKLDAFYKAIKGKRIKIVVPVGKMGTGFIRITQKALHDFLLEKPVKTFTADIWESIVYVEGFNY